MMPNLKFKILIDCTGRYEYKGVKELIGFNHTVSNSKFYAIYLIIESTIIFFSQPFVWVTVEPYKTTQFQGELPT